MNLPPLQAWNICQQDGSVVTAHCMCMAGISEVCSHVGALLYAAEYISTAKANTSCTDVRAMWNVPSVSQTKVEYMPVSSINYGPTFTYSDSQSIPAISAEELNNMLFSINKDVCSSALMRVTEPFASQIAMEMECNTNLNVVNPYKGLYEDELFSYSLEDLITLGISLNIQVSGDDCRKIQEITIEQSASQMWFEQRIGRITASHFKGATRTSVAKPSLSLIKQICYPLECTFKTAATEWGKKHEKDALEAYKHENQICHEQLELKPVGLCVHPDYPYFGASPDALVSCSCCGSGCVEVKCPYVLRKKSIEEMTMNSSFFLKQSENGISLDKSHTYYFQIQQQMAVTKTFYCDFVVWSPSNELFVERVQFDAEFWHFHSEKSAQFHKKVIMPELLGKYFTQNSEKTLTYCICKSTEDNLPMICCDNENCKIKWYHFKCINLKEIPKNLWLCSNCR